MKILICFAVVLAFVSATGANFDGKVVSLNASNFDEIVLKSKVPFMVKFFAPWCGWCKKLAPEFAAAAELLKGKAVLMGEFDCTKAKSFCQKYGVKGYPTVLTFKENKEKPVKYFGARKRANIAKYMESTIV